MLKRIFITFIFLLIVAGFLLRFFILRKAVEFGFSDIKIERVHFYPFQGQLAFPHVVLRTKDFGEIDLVDLHFNFLGFCKTQKLPLIDLFIKSINFKTTSIQESLFFFEQTIKKLFNGKFNLVEKIRVEDGVFESKLSDINHLKINFAFKYFHKQNDKIITNFDLFSNKIDFSCVVSTGSLCSNIKSGGVICFDEDLSINSKILSKIFVQFNNETFEVNSLYNCPNLGSDLKIILKKDGCESVLFNYFKNYNNNELAEVINHPLFFAFLSSEKEILLSKKSPLSLKNILAWRLLPSLFYEKDNVTSRMDISFLEKNPVLIVNQFSTSQGSKYFGYFNPDDNVLQKTWNNFFVKLFSFDEKWSFISKFVQGEGLFVQGRLLDDSKLYKNILYNQLRNFSGNLSINYDERKIFLHNLNLNFFGGKIKISDVELSFFEKPLLTGEIDVRDFIFTMPSLISQNNGKFSISMDMDSLNISGDLLCNKGFCEVTSLYGLFKNQEMSSSEITPFPWKTNLDLKIKTSKNICCMLGTSKLLIDGVLNLSGPVINSNFNNLKVFGDVNLCAKNLPLLGHEFEKIKLNLFFENSLLQNPLIRANLRTRINRYLVDFDIFGVSDDLLISAKSLPQLSESQIFSLFFTGIRDHSDGLRHLLSALIVKSGQNAISGVENKKNLLQKIFFPAKNIRLFPSLNNVSGTSFLPLSASLLVNLGENFSAIIEKDLKNYDELKLSLEYLITENCLLRCNRDFEGMLQGLVEFKFKF